MVHEHLTGLIVRLAARTGRGERPLDGLRFQRDGEALDGELAFAWDGALTLRHRAFHDLDHVQGTLETGRLPVGFRHTVNAWVEGRDSGHDNAGLA